jgi:hypothetical protein
MSNESEGYLAYMLRLWQADGGDRTAWRASLESPHTGERQGFSNLELLFAFLEEKTVGVDSQMNKGRPVKDDGACKETGDD